jgi:hypothetical protein
MRKLYSPENGCNDISTFADFDLYRTLDDDMDLGYASPMHMTLGESMSTMGGPFCYRYT